MKGIDVSHWQENIDWSAVKNSGIDFAVVKLTEGETILDSYGRTNIINAKKAGLIVGAYHFGWMNDEGKAIREANYFRKNLQGLNVDFVALDIESRSLKGDLTNASLAFLDAIKDIGSTLFYADPDFIKEHFNSAITKYPLWIANQNVSKPDIRFWGNWSLWQYAIKSGIPGISGNVDVDYMQDGFIKPVVAPAPKPTDSNVLNIRFLQHEFNVQYGAGLAEDNITGPKTLAAASKVLVKIGARGNITKWVQNRLNSLGYNCGVADGIFGTITFNAIIAFQKAHGLSADGIIGPNTWKYLLN